MLGNIDAELKLVIAGNHDLSLDGEWWRTHVHDEDDSEEHSHATEIMTGPLAEEAGVTYLEEGTHSFTLKNGARFTIYASPYTPLYGGWAFMYRDTQDRFNLSDQVSNGVTSIAQNPMPSFPAVEIVMTHGPPKGILDSCAQGHVGCENLLRAVGRAKPLVHCFGHIHEGYGARKVSWEEAGMRQRRVPPNTYPEPNSIPLEFGEETLMINAATLDGMGKPVNAPWLLDLDLPRSL